MDSNSEHPKVSVCVITYNQKEYIGQCLQSIIEQKTDFLFEVIVGDDCSTDGTEDVVRKFAEKYPKLIRGVFLHENIGSGCNNYRVVNRLAGGAYVSTMDGDDEMLPGKLQQQADALDKDPVLSMVAHKALYISAIGTEILVPEKDQSTAIRINDILWREPPFTSSSTMYRRSNLKTPSVIDQDLFMDFEVQLELASAGVIGYLNQPLVKHGKRPGSITARRGEAHYTIIARKHDAILASKQYGVSILISIIAAWRYLISSLFFLTDKNIADRVAFSMCLAKACPQIIRPPLSFSSHGHTVWRAFDFVMYNIISGLGWFLRRRVMANEAKW